MEPSPTFLPYKSADIAELIRDPNNNDHDFFDESITERVSYSFI